MAQGEYVEAKASFQEGVDMQQGLADVLLAAKSEAESMNYLAQRPSNRDLLISVCLHVPDSDEASYARVWRGKAALARILQRRQTGLFELAAGNAAARRDIERWRDIRGQLARLLLVTAGGRDNPGRLARLQQLSVDKERLERQLADAIPRLARDQTLERSPHTKLLEALPERAVVLDVTYYLRIEQDPQDTGKSGERHIPSYIGYVLARGRPVRAVDLGPAVPIDEAVRAWREAIKDREASPAAETLRRLVWQPLARQFAPRRRP